MTVKELREKLERGTRAPWSCEKGARGWRLLYHGPTQYRHWEENRQWALLGQYDMANSVDEYSEADAAAIVALRNSADAMLDVVEAAKAVTAHHGDAVAEYPPAVCTCDLCAALAKLEGAGK